MSKRVVQLISLDFRINNPESAHELFRIHWPLKFQFNPFPNDKILGSCKLKGFEDDNFKFDKNGRKFSKRVENTMGKGEIARYEQFLLFTQCFQITSTVDT